MSYEKGKSIMAMKWEEAQEIAYIAAGQPENFELKKMDRRDDQGGPHVKLTYTCFEPIIGHGITGYVGIFENLNTYLDGHFSSAYCQVELFECYRKYGYYSINENKPHEQQKQQN